MNYRKVGNSGLYISELSIGTWSGEVYSFNYSSLIPILEKSIESGINYIDTSNSYGNGEAENIVGKFVSTIVRENILIGTKVFGPMDNSWMSQGLSLRNILNSCHRSLERMNLEYIDLYQCHKYDYETPLEETCYAMHNLIERGLIKYWGVSKWSVMQLMKAITICNENRWQKPISVQCKYNLLDRSIEIDMMEFCNAYGIGILGYSPLAQGILTGKYLGKNQSNDTRMRKVKSLEFFPADLFNKNKIMLLELETYLEGNPLSMSEFALKWCIRHNVVSSIIMGASNSVQIERNINSLQSQLDSEMNEKIEIILDNKPRNQYTDKEIGYPMEAKNTWFINKTSINK